MHLQNMANSIGFTHTRALILALALFYYVVPSISEPVPVPVTSIELNGSNWYPLKLDNWPKQDEAGIASETQRFYYVHGEQGEFSKSHPFLRLKSNYFQDSNLDVSDSVSLSFKYWSNSGSTHFQSTYDSSKDVVLSQTGQWTEVSSVEISSNRWSYYEFYNPENFNFILKDIRVQSIGNSISSSKQPHSSMTSFKRNSKLHLSNVRELNLNAAQPIIRDIAKTGGDVDTMMLQFEGIHGSVASEYFRDWTTIEFTLQLRSIAGAFKVKITKELETKTSARFLGSSASQYKFTSQPEFPANLKESFQFGFDPKWSSTTVNVTVYPYIGFSLWNFKVGNTSLTKSNLEQSSQMRIPETGDKVQSKHFLVSSSSKDNSSYVTLLIEDAGDLTQENCFLWVKSSEGMTIDLYMTFEGESYGRKVSQLVGLNDEFCTSSLMYLRLHEAFQLTFVFKTNRELIEPFLFNLNYAKVSITHARTLSKGLKGPLDIADYNPKTMSHSPIWWFYNPKLFDYAVVSNSKGSIYACDMMANCFPYERNQELDSKRDNQTVWNFTIAEEVKKLLSHTPVIRLYTEDPKAIIYIDAPYLRTKEGLLERVKSRLLAQTGLNVTNSKVSDNKFQILVFGQTKIPLEIPIGEIDLRANVINITIDSIGGQSRRIHLVSLKLNNQAVVENIRIDTSLDGGPLVISTDEFISIRPWKLVHDIRTFAIEFEVEEPSGMAIDLQIEISVKVNDHRVTYSRDLWSVLPNGRKLESESDFPDDRVTKFTPEEPRALILSKWIHSGSGMSLNDITGEIDFRVFPEHSLTKSDILVTRIVFGTENTYFTQTPMDVHFNGGGSVGTLIDNFTIYHEDQILLSGPFRIGYLVELKVNASVTLQFTPKIKSFPAFDQKNCQKGPTYGDLDCQSEVYHCPDYYFTKSSTWNGYECIRVRLPQLMQDLCDPFTGCANIFDRRLPSSGHYGNDRGSQLRGNTYFPPSFGKNSHLRVNFPASHNTSNDFCVQFDYVAYQAELIVTPSLTHPALFAFIQDDTAWYDGEVCASKFHPAAHPFDSFYFYFLERVPEADEQQDPEQDPAPSVVGGEIAQHMLSNLRYVIVNK